MSGLDPWENAPLDWREPDPSPRDPLLDSRSPGRGRGGAGDRRSTRPEPIRHFDTRPSVDDLPEEHPLAIEINGRTVDQLQFSGDGARELALGWSFGRGVIDRLGAVQRTTVYPDRVSLMIPDCGEALGAWGRFAAAGYRADARPRLWTDMTPDPSEDFADRPALTTRARLMRAVDDLFARFRRAPFASLVHHAGVASAGDGSVGKELRVVARDIGAEHAVDKVIGWLVANRMDRPDLALVLSFPLSAGIVARTARAGIPVIATSASTTVEAIDLAHALGLTTATGVLGNRLAIYTHPWRISHDDGES